MENANIAAAVAEHKGFPLRKTLIGSGIGLGIAGAIVFTVRMFNRHVY